MIELVGTADERERRLREIHLDNVRLRKSQIRKVYATLESAFTAGPMTLREFRQLAALDYQAPVISLYLNFTPQNVVRADRPVFLSVFDSLRHGELERRKPYLETLTRAQRARLEQDLAEIKIFLEGFRPQGARSIALFKSGQQLNRGMALPVRSADSLTIDPDPYVEPLESLLEANRRVLIMELSKEKAALAIFELGQVEVVDTVKGPRMEDLVEATPRPEDKEQRHVETHLQWHFEAVVRRASHLFRDRVCDLVALVGEASVLDAFDDYLPKALKAKVLVRLHPSPGQSRAGWLGEIAAALGRLREQEETTALGELGMYRARGRLATGLKAVLEPVNLLLARQLLVSAELQQPGWLCRQHHYLSLEPGRCPFDGQELAPSENVVDELVEVARLHGVDVMVVEKRLDVIAGYGGVAAVTLPVGAQG